ncbi:unnamed protein product [Pleuronectes platessa]|uniref:Uncharacterized protein n=1 Tax=Pleuronectes platessa TaxID=8262 RepID=A0A9N7VRA3_PLEPL|nr:unnamed protein product [Pleuronectes platessa]
MMATLTLSDRLTGFAKCVSGLTGSSEGNGRRSEAGFLYTMTQSLHITPIIAESPHLQCGKTTPLYLPVL